MGVMPAPPRKTTNTDVRMRGFAERTTVEDALEWLDSVLPQMADLPMEEVSLGEAAGRVFAHDVISPVNVPSFARSMMDGFALRGEDTYGASPYNRLPLKIIGSSMPGRPFLGDVAPGQAVRIMTGAPLPAGADSVLPAENTQFDGAELFALDQISQGKNVGQVGEDLRTGEIVAAAGRTLRPQDIGLLSSVGCRVLPVIRKPRMRILITGNEILPAGTPSGGCRIADANGPMLAALVLRDGGEPLLSEIIPDDPGEIRTALEQPADIIVVSGGSSVGQEDYVPTLLAELGELAVHGVAMRPAAPPAWAACMAVSFSCSQAIPCRASVLTTSSPAARFAPPAAARATGPIERFAPT